MYHLNCVTVGLHLLLSDATTFKRHHFLHLSRPCLEIRRWDQSRRTYEQTDVKGKITGDVFNKFVNVSVLAALPLHKDISLQVGSAMSPKSSERGTFKAKIASIATVFANVDVHTPPKANVQRSTL